MSRKAISSASSLLLCLLLYARPLPPAVPAHPVQPPAAAARGTVLRVADDVAFRRALAAAGPGHRIVLGPGKYGPGVYAAGLRGTAEAPVVIEAADPADKPAFEGGAVGLHFSGCEYLLLRNLAVRGQSGNGINIDDGGKADAPARHVTLEGIHVSDVGPRGNLDAIKVSGVDGLVVRGCVVEGWGGEGIDMVGCHRVEVENCTFRGKPGFSQATGVQAKGGSSEVVIRRCTFVDAGQRAVNVGGSTGAKFFRPAGAKYEARDVTVEGCRFAGGMTPVAFVGVDGAVVRYNTIYHPDKWVFRILQENSGDGMVPSRGGAFERNLVVYRRDRVREPANVGPGTDAAGFRFADNWWYCEDAPARAARPCRRPSGAGRTGTTRG